MHAKPSLFQIISIGFLIVGKLIGAGILALPINTGLAGFIFAISKARTSTQRMLGIVMLLLFGLFFIFEAGQESGLLIISPDTEYWK